MGSRTPRSTSLTGGSSWGSPAIEEREAEAGDQGVTGLKDFQAFRSQRRGGVGPGAGVAVVVRKAAGLADLLEGMPFQKQGVDLGEAVGAGDQHQGPLPEVLLLVVLGQASAQIAGLADVHPSVVIACVFSHQHIKADLAALLHRQEVRQQDPGYLDHLHDTGGDLGDADAMRFAARQEDLDRFGGAAHAASASGAKPRTSIWPVTAAEIRAERRS